MKKLLLVFSFVLVLLGSSSLYLQPVSATEAINLLKNIPTIDGKTEMTDGDYSTFLVVGGPKFTTNVYTYEFTTPVNIISMRAYGTDKEHLSYSDEAKFYNSKGELIKTITSVGQVNVLNVSKIVYSYPRNLGPFNVAELVAYGSYANSETPSELQATAGNGQVNLTWNSTSNALSYNVKRSATPGGPYEIIANTTTNSFIDANVTNGSTYYYVVTSVNSSGESPNSNEVSATPNGITPGPDPQPTGDRAILTITMTTGLEKEYDLSLDEVNSFIKWYDAKDAGTGPSKYAISKHNNNKGPFSKRTDYVIFNNILTFEVNEYSTATSATYQ